MITRSGQKMTQAREYALLPTPKTTFYFDPAGVVEAAYIQIRAGRPVRTVQPVREHMVSLYLGRGDVLLGFKMLEPVPIPILSRILRVGIRGIKAPGLKVQLRAARSRLAEAAA